MLVNCTVCKGEFDTPSNGKFCSKGCRSIAGKAQAQRERQARRLIINEIKMKSGCVLCGFKGHPAALHFDHRDPETKLFDVSRCMKTAWGKMEAEIAKCDILCANCHSIRTYTENHYVTARK